MRASTILGVATLSTMLLLTGCKKKQPQTTPPPPQPAPVETPAPPPPPPPAPAPAPTPPPSPFDGDLDAVNSYVNERGLIADVYFDYDRDGLRDDARARLQKNADFMKEQPQFLYSLEGHCDERGSIGYNVALGDRRASSAKGYIVSLGVADGRMKTVSYGKERPVCKEADESCWSKNRRVHFVITGRR
jgi:peptidoglycan-associated lipoprotein